MDRHRYRESIELVADTIKGLPVAFRQLLEGVDFLCDYDPIFVGFDRGGKSPDGRDSRKQSYVLYSNSCIRVEPKSRRKTTIVLNRNRFTRGQMGLIILHELGHAIHERLGFPAPFVALDWYAKTTPYEAFATSFQSFCSTEPWIESECYHTRDFMRERDPLGHYFFSKVAENKHQDFRVNQ